MAPFCCGPGALLHDVHPENTAACSHAGWWSLSWWCTPTCRPPASAGMLLSAPHRGLSCLMHADSQLQQGLQQAHYNMVGFVTQQNEISRQLSRHGGQAVRPIH